MESQLEQHPGFLLLRVTGDLRLWNRQGTEEKLLDTLRSGLQENDARQVVLSLVGVKHIDSLGLTAILRVLNECRQRKMQLKVVLPPGVPGQAMKATRIFEAWSNFEDEAAAVRAAGGLG